MFPDKLLSKIEENYYTKYNILGIKFSIKNQKFYKQNEESIKVQDKYDLSELKRAKKLILFLVPPKAETSGGIMSIFSLCEASREINPDTCTIISTFPGKYTYAKHDGFSNQENVYRFSQIVENCVNLDNLIIHIPEYYAKNFYSKLSGRDIKFLKSIKNLQINIMNQNIELMPEPEELQDLYKLTDNITQTIAHDRYANQEVCDKWQIPTHLFSVNIDLSRYKSYTFEEKEKIIVLSPDENPNKEKIVEKLKTGFPDWKLITVQNMTFSEYMDLISRAFFTITFGEGIDGYFTQPQYVNSVGFAVYNDDFFPNKDWKNLKNVYNSYDDLFDNIVTDITTLSCDNNKYNSIISDFFDNSSKVYKIDKFKDNLERFYKKEYDYVPRKV